MPKPVTVALIGNPNVGKSTLFNALSGVRQRTGNYPGVTVEKKIGRMEFHQRSYSLVDLPGTYSLAPRSPDEMIAVDVLLGRRGDVAQPDVVLCIVDASNLERNLYLVSQVLELGRPTVLALNMIDVAHDKGLTLDVDRLRKQLDVPIVEIRANSGWGMGELKEALAAAADGQAHTPTSPFPEPFQAEVRSLAALERKQGEQVLPRYLIERLILDTGGYLEQAHLDGVNGSILAEVRAARARLAEAGFQVPAVEAVSRYKWVGEVLDGVVTRPKERRETFSDKVDRVLTHKILGSLIFILVMIVLFMAVFLVADPASGLIDWMNGELTVLVEAWVPAGALRSLLVNGVIGGVGGVLGFLPQIFTLFLFIAVLEDCGYMSRAAYLMDKLMSRVGLSGKSFIPLLSSFACAIPGIMGTRVIENPRDRLTTILVAPLMSCSARLPVYVLLIAAFMPQQPPLYGLFIKGITLFAMYSIGIVTAVIVAFALKRTMLRGATPPFVMELPAYKVPGLGIVVHRMLERGWAFVRRAGTLIFAVSVVVWAAAYYPRNEAAVDPALRKQQADLERRLADLDEHITLPGHDVDDHAEERETLEKQLAEVDNEIEGEYLEDSFLGRAGHFVAPVVRPLGWDWRIGCAAIASFPAREVVIATLGVIYKLGEEQDEESETLKETLRGAKWEGTGEPVFNIPVALSIMVFFALCAQCGATLAVIRRETNSWRWPIFTFTYMTVLAYLGALVTYQVGMLLTSA